MGDRRRGIFATLLVCALLATGAPVSAQVYEIQDDGSVLQRADAPMVSWVRPGTDASPETAGVHAGEPATKAFMSSVAPPQIPGGWGSALNSIAAKYDLSPALLEAVVWQESRWRTNAVSSAGARGLTQLMPGTAQAMGVNPDDPVSNLEGGARYLRIQLNTFNGNVEHALAAYNAGPGRVIKAGGVPNIAETKNYVRAIMARLASRSLAAQ